jgi:hypothetical protein
VDLPITEGPRTGQQVSLRQVTRSVPARHGQNRQVRSLTSRTDLAAAETSDAVKLSSCGACRRGGAGEGGGFVVVLAGGQAVVAAAQEPSEEVALGGGVPVAVGLAPVVVGSGAG